MPKYIMRDIHRHTHERIPLMHHYHPTYDDAPDPRDFIDTCYTCEGTGWKEGRSHFAPASFDYCHCDTGKQLRTEARQKQEADWQAAKDEGLWDHPEHWPW